MLSFYRGTIKKKKEKYYFDMEPKRIFIGKERTLKKEDIYKLENNFYTLYPCIKIGEDYLIEIHGGEYSLSFFPSEQEEIQCGKNKELYGWASYYGRFFYKSGNLFSLNHRDTLMVFQNQF